MLEQTLGCTDHSLLGLCPSHTDSFLARPLMSCASHNPFLKSYGSIVCCACSSRSSWAYTAGGTNAFQHNPTWCRQVDTWTCLMHSEYVWCAELNSYDVSHFLHACLACGYCFKKIWFMVVVVGYLSPILGGATWRRLGRSRKRLGALRACCTSPGCGSGGDGNDGRLGYGH